jgi:hypothetical protein
MTELNLFTAFSLVVQHPNGTYEQVNSISNGEVPGRIDVQQSGQVTINSTQSTGNDTTEGGRVEPVCLRGTYGQFNGGFGYTPEIAGSYKFDFWVVYTFGTGDYDYQKPGFVCLNPPFTCESIPFRL